MNKIEKKFSFSNIFGHWVVVAFIVLTILICFMGFIIDYKIFFINLIAGICSVFLSFFLALFIVDKYLKYQREQQWSKVNKITLYAISVHLCEIVGSLSFYFLDMDHDLTLPFFSGQKFLNEATLMAFKPLLSALNDERQIVPLEAARRTSSSDIAVEYYEALSWDMDQIQNVLTPRVMISSTDQALIDALIEFGDARRALRHSINEHKQVHNHVVYEKIPPFFRSTERIYEVIYEYYKVLNQGRSLRYGRDDKLSK